MSENPGGLDDLQAPGPESPKPERWASWITPGGASDPDYQNIQSPVLKRIVKSIAKAPDGIADIHYLTQKYLQIERLAEDGTIPEDEANYYLVTIGQRHQELAQDAERARAVEGLAPLQMMTDLVAGSHEEGGRLRLPEDIDQQRAYVRRILDEVEDSKQDCFDYANVRSVRSLEVSLKQMHPEIASEVKVRLALHDASELIKKAGGFITRREGDPGYTISIAATEAQRRNHEIDRDVVDAIINNRLPGFKTKAAWNLLQEANYEYARLVEDYVDGAVLLQFWVSRGWNSNQRQQVEDLLKRAKYDVQRVYGNKDEKDANKLDPQEKAWLQGMLSEADMQQFFSIAGTEAADADPALGRVPTNYFVDSNTKRKDAVREVLIAKLTSPNGSVANAEKSLQLAEKLAIASLETSVWNRSALAGNDELAESLGFQEWRARRRIQGRDRGPQIHELSIGSIGTSWLRMLRDGADDLTQPLYADDINLEKITAGAWQGHCGFRLNRYQALKGLFLDRAPKPRAIDQNFLRKAVPYFNEVDKPEDGINPDTGESWKVGDKFLRVWWLAGVVDMAVSDPNLGWGPSDLVELMKTVAEDRLSDEAGTFITVEQWKWIEDQTNMHRRISKQQFGEFVRGALKAFTSGGGGGGKKR